MNLLSETLKLSKKVLLKDPYQLASQLIGRLHQIVAADKPVAPGTYHFYLFILFIFNKFNFMTMAFVLSILWLWILKCFNK